MRSVAVAVLLLAALPQAALAQQAPSGPAQTPAGCEPGFQQSPYAHGSALDFTCRSMVAQCPLRPDHEAKLFVHPTVDSAGGVQFGYRCEYIRRR